MKGFLAPATGLMNGLKYPGKFAVMGSLALLAVTVLVAGLATRLYESIRLARQELAATELIEPLHRQIRLTQQHRGISAAFLGGDAAMKGRLEDKRAEVDAALRAAAEVEARHSELFGSRIEWLAIQGDWQRLAAGLTGMRAGASLALHGQLIKRLLRFQEAIADAGALSVDSEIHTYYLGQTLVKSLPDMLERLGKLRAKGTEVLVQRKLSLADRVELAAQANLLTTDFESLERDLAKVALRSPEVAPRLEAFIREIAAASGRASVLLDTDIASETFAVAPKDFYDKFTQAIDIGYGEMFATLLPTLNQQLAERIFRLQAHLALEVGLALLFLLLLGYVSLGAYQSIMESVRRLSAGAGIMAGGDLGTRIRLEGRDELASVAEAMNAMAGALDDLLHASERTAKELAAALAEAKQADQTKDAFLANVSHELRTPLNAVIGFAELARRDGCAQAKQADYLDKIANAGSTLSQIVNDLLDLSKIAAGRMELDPETFRLRQLISRVRSIMSFKLAEKRLQLIDRIGGEVPDLLFGDKLRIEQLLLNLLSNAVKFTHQGRVELRLGLLAQEAGRVCLSIEVEDSGIGMSEEEIARLFQPFSQADVTMSRKYGGTGLGLALCKRLAQMMGGDIGVVSQPGRGSTFRVVLWLGSGDAADLATEVDPDSQGVLGLRYLGARVLVVDDQPMNREIAQELLSCVGIATRLAENGRAALDILVEEGPAAFDLVLMDIQMPVLDGLAATRELRARPEFAKLPVIAMTAHTMEHERALSIAAGLNDHIGKPFEAARFYGVLAKWIAPAKQVPAPERPDGEGDAAGWLDTALGTLVGIDVAAGIARFGGNESRYRHWLDDFATGAGATVDQIRADVAGADLESAAKRAHTLKGRVGMLGMGDLHEAAAALETALRQGGPAERPLAALEGAVRRMQGELARLRDIGAGGRRGLTKVSWSEAYSVGVAELDAQHKKLIDMINQLADYALHTSEAAEHSGALHEILSAVFDYTRSHFKTEEEYLQKTGYAELPSHAAEHAAFVEKISAFGIASASGVLEAAKMHHYLMEWLGTHILETDMRYKPQQPALPLSCPGSP